MVWKNSKLKMTPDKYQAKHEGSWYNWTSGHVDTDDLRRKISKSIEPIYINGCQVFALRFNNGQEWTTKEGWK